MIVHATVLLVGSLLAFQADDLAVLRKEALGDWQRQIEYNGQPHRLVKHIEENQETLSLYSPANEVVYQHIVNYEISLRDNIGVFEFWNMRVLVQEENAEESDQATPSPDARFSYVFKIHNNTWHEVQGLRRDLAEAPSINIYQRVTGDPATPAPVSSEPEATPPGKQELQPLAFLIGNWQNSSDPNDRRTYEWINNKSYIMFLLGDYREVIGWDLVHERIVSWSYGTDGGQGRGLWTRQGDTWTYTSRSFLDRWGNPMQPYAMTVERIDENTLKFTSVGRNADGKPDYEATYQRITKQD
ncbi:MAG: hypothetical protein MUF48_07380 [Pirellulaceae bacterium]|jgi:hypothetical protein|nr:hypothetical protein [Pirellulaceae bacterium]